MIGTGRTDSPALHVTAQSAFPLHKRVLTALAAVSILGSAGCAGAQADSPAAESQAELQAESQAADAPTETTTAAPTAADGAAPGSDPATTEDAAGDQAYEDGTYTETGGYQSPAGPEEVGVTITLEADVVTAVEVEPMPDNPTTTMYQERFAGGISDAIVGKKLDDLDVDKVAGSSLTSGGFNEATDKIKSEARI